MKSEKHLEYAKKLISQIALIFDEECENHIDIDEFQDDKNLTDFFHALSNVVPTYYFNKLTGVDKDNLQLNHMANRLLFQYSQLKKDK